jgi:hypothetical protein
MSVRVPPAIACLHRQSAIRCELDVLTCKHTETERERERDSQE